DYLTSKEALAQAMDSLAVNNFNVVYVNAWSRGYPLWQSQVFYNETNMYIDPGFTGRDILAEAIAEGHKRGLHVEAWFEYGFVGGYTNYLPGTSGKGKIFDVHPDWVAKKIDGSEKDDSNFYWMVQTRKDVQDFLIALVTEVCRKYDIDGIELDRIRYSSVQYGYDSYTDSLYRAENGGTPPPINTTDQNWIRWRADKLNQFAARVYDSVKAINPKINLSNAPSLYSSSQYTSYYSFCQDWVWWVNNNKIDNVQVQSYVGSASTFSNILNYIKTLVNDINKVYPAFAVQPGTSPLPLSEILAMIDNARSKGFKGNSIWYYTDLRSFLNSLKLNRYTESVSPPYSDLNWRKFTRIVTITDTLNAVRFGKWFTSLLQGFSSPSIYANGGDSASIDYFVDVPADGYYEIYPFIVTASDRSSSA
ncbi:MAG: family 10 glycosylhydrolase, partial [Ignavibacteria bacterium]|nr:family 10 glycosylhydrolase [Ignavibacteria bacterium]